MDERMDESDRGIHGREQGIKSGISMEVTARGS